MNTKNASASPILFSFTWSIAYRIFKTIAGTFMLTFSLLIICFLLLISSESGSRWLINNIFSNISQVSVDAINGSIINQLNLRNLKYEDANDFSVVISDIKCHWTAQQLLQGQLHISLLQMNEITINGQPASSTDKQGESTIPQIPISINFDKLLLKQINWQNKGSSQSIQQLSLSAQLQQKKLSISDLSLLMQNLEINAQSEVTMQSNWPLSVDLDWHFNTGEDNLNGHVAIKGNMNKLALISNIEGTVESELSGFILLSKNQPEINLTANWNKFQWPLSGESAVSSQQGNFTIVGNTNHYQANLNGAIQTSKTSGFSLNLVATGNDQGLDIASLQLKPQQGELDMQGQLSWAQPFSFDLAITSRQLNPADFIPDISGVINLKATTKGNIDGGNINAELDIKKLAGTIHEQPINAKGKVNLTNQQISFQEFELFSADSKIKATGQLSEQSADLAIKISAPDLKSLWPTLDGKLNGDLLINGSISKPIVKSNIKGHDIRFKQNKIGSISLQGDYFHASDLISTIEFSANDLTIDGRSIKHLTLDGNGNQNNHAVQLTLNSALSNLNIATHGHWNGEQWQGQISQLAIDHPELKKWQLQSPADLLLAIKNKQYSIDLAESCLVQNQSKLCLTANRVEDTLIDGGAILTNFPLALTKTWLPKELTVSGNLSAQAKFSSSSNNLLAIISANIDAGEMLLQDQDNIKHKFPFTTERVQFNLDKDQLSSQINIALDNDDYIRSELNTGQADAKGIRQLSGSLQSTIKNLSVIDGLIPQINQLQGIMVTDLEFSGNSANPIITGNANWRNGQLSIDKLGSTFKNINLQANSTHLNPERLILSLSMQSGSGKLSGNGYLDMLPAQKFPVELSLNGENFQISQLPEAEVNISPQLTISKTNSLTKIDGLIKIDKAKVEILTLPESAILPSEDEIIISSEQVKQKKINPDLFNTHIAIQFGDNSHFSGFGLKTRLTGKLNYIMEQDKQSMQGRAEMQQATYQSYGQDLTIRKGEFLFNGSADNPWLNIEAIRESNNKEVTAILNVSGQLKNPQTRIYTEPALAESEALAYLVTGNSLTNMSQSDGSAVANAAFNYGSGQLSWLNDQLGIDEMEFEQGEKIEDSAVRLGKYLNPDLYVGISMGLFASKYAADLKYNLTDHFRISTRAGETQRIDLEYHLETE